MVDEFGNEVPVAEPDLPPAGYKREEVLAARTDILEEEIDKKSKDTLAIDPSKLEVDREIRHELDKGELDVTDADPSYVYRWVQCDRPLSNPARMVDLLRYKSVTYNGTRYPTWEVVRGEMKEACEKKTALGTRKIGDTMLMRCHKNTYKIIEDEERRKRTNRQFGIDDRLIQLAESAGTKAGQQVYVDHGGRGSSEMDLNIDTGNIPNIRR